MAVNRLELELEVRTAVVGDCLEVIVLVNDRELISVLQDLKQQSFKEAMIKLGWTPPREDNCHV